MFLSKLKVEVGEPGEFTLLDTLIFEIQKHIVIEVPKGFITDFASVPKLLRMVPGFDVNGKSRAAAVVHDFLYCARGWVLLRPTTGKHSLFSVISRASADAIFRQALIECGASRIVAWSMYAGVRAGGWLYWNKRKGLEASDFVVGTTYGNVQP